MSYSRKHLRDTALSDNPVPKENQFIAKVVELRGSNVCEVQLPNGSKILAQIPTKFRKTIWIKVGNYLIVHQPPNWEEISLKVKSMVESVLYPDSIKNLKKLNLWPAEFDQPVSQDSKQEQSQAQNISKQKSEDNSDEEDDDLLEYNPNHVVVDDSD